MSSILLDGSLYSEKSVVLVKDFILNCKQALKETPFLWIAFQSNSLNDRCYSAENFESEFGKMIEFLRNELKFYSPNLTLNMRNSNEVGKLAKTMKSEVNKVKITNVIESLPTPKSSITSTKPILIPISSLDLKHNYLKLFDKATEKGEMRVILIESEHKIDVKEIKEALLKFDINEEDIFVHLFDSNNTKEDVKEFLANENGFLICEAELFTGMEADSVVYCTSDIETKNVRVNVMRACSKLNIIYCYYMDENDFTGFTGAKLDPTFMSGCHKEMTRFAFQCLRCEKAENNFDNDDEDDVIICKPCLIRCHSGHKVNSITVQSSKSKLKNKILKCECKTKCLNCNLIYR